MANKTISFDDRLYDYFARVAYDEPAILADLRKRTHSLADAMMQITPSKAPSWGSWSSSPVRAAFSRSAPSPAIARLPWRSALPADGRLMASDVSAEWTAIAREFWAKAGLADRIELVLKPGRDVIADLLKRGEAGHFDMMFIDADKSNYDHYYEGGLRLLRQGGLMMIDNVLWGGDVADATKTDKDTSALRALNAKVRADTRVDFVMVPIGDGLTLIRKR